VIRLIGQESLAQLQFEVRNQRIIDVLIYFIISDKLTVKYIISSIIYKEIIVQGIYKISCLQDSRVYIGSSNNIKRRWSEHVRDLNKGNHRNYKLQDDWDAYGDESFIFEVLEETENLIVREQLYLDKVLDNCYNLSLKVTNPMSNPEVVKKQQASLNLSGKRGNQKLSEEQVYEIVELLKNKHTAAYISKKYKVSTKLISSIVDGTKWKSVTDITGLPRKQKRISEEDIIYIRKLMLEGVSNTDISRILDISYSTARTYIDKIKAEKTNTINELAVAAPQALTD